MANPNQDARSRGTGRYVRTPEAATRATRAAELRGQGWTLQEIADELGYASKGSVHNAIDRVYRTIAAPARAAFEREEQRLERLWEEAEEVLERAHPMVSGGKIVHDDDGQPLPDYGPRLAALDRALKVRESFRKLKGLDAKQSIDIALSRRLDLEGETVAGALTAALDALNLTEEQRTAAVEAAHQYLLAAGDSAPDASA